MSFLILAVTFLRSLFKSHRRLVLENLALRQQVTMLRQSVKRPRATVADRLFWILFSRYVDGWLKVLHGLHPDTVVRWHRQGFRFYWRWKSRGQKPGRPAIDAALRKLIREMQAANIGWSAPRILREYFSYYHTCRTHLSLNKDPPESRMIEPLEMGNIIAQPRVGGLHHRYGRIAA